MVLAAGASTLLGNLLSRGDRRRARQAQQRQEALLQRMTQFAEEGRARGSQMLDQWNRDFMPVTRDAIAAAQQVGRPDLDAVSADNAAAFGAQRGAITRSMQRAGINPADSSYANVLGELGNAEALGLVTARNTARRGAANERANALAGVAGLGNPLLSAGAGLYGQAPGVLAGAADGFGANAAMYRDSAAATQSAVGQMAGQFFAGLGKGGAPGGAGVGGAGGNFKGIPWGSFVSRAGPWRPQFGGQPASPAGAPGYFRNPAAGWWSTGGR